MTDAHQTLLNLLRVEALEVDLFRGAGQGVRHRRAFLVAK